MFGFSLGIHQLKDHGFPRLPEVSHGTSGNSTGAVQWLEGLLVEDVHEGALSMALPFAAARALARALAHAD